MADKRKGRKKREEIADKPTKEEYAVAKYMRKNLAVKKTSLMSHKVEYFIASKAVDCLLDSPWATNKKGKETLFTSRESVVDYLNTMLFHKFFHRAKKIQVSQKELKSKKKLKDQDDSAHEKDDKKSSDKKKKDLVTKEKETDSKKQGTENDGNKEKKKEKRKIRLDMHLDQIFLDGNEAYVWIYDPIPTTAWLIGSLLVVGAILLCLFPLWPSSVRKGVYYVSVAAAAFLCVIVALIIMRLIIFCFVWLISFGKHHLWILPNLTEDVGFFESFWPLFKYEYKGSEKQKEEKTKSNKNKDKKDKDNSDQSESDSEDSRDREGTNGDNGFEIVNQEELESDSNKTKKKTRKEKRS